MGIKNFKGEKNYRKWARPSTVHVLSKEQKPRLQFQKEKLPAMIAYGTSILSLGTLGFFLADLPGILVGAIAGQQLGKFGLSFFTKKKKR